jgi:hypothetical protein
MGDLGDSLMVFIYYLSGIVVVTVGIGTHRSNYSTRPLDTASKG